MSYITYKAENNTLIKSWVNGVHIDSNAIQQLQNLANLPIIYKWVAAMPDVHVGIGATIGSVIPTKDAIIPASVGVDLGCGMVAIQTSLTAKRLPDNLANVRQAMELAVPHGRGSHGGKGAKGSWNNIPESTTYYWEKLEPGFKKIVEKHPVIEQCNNVIHLGTLGTGNHFIEMCLDEENKVWFMLHSGSRGVGNKIGTYFIALAKKDMETHIKNLPDKNLAYLREGTQHFEDYVEAVQWAQKFAFYNRILMMNNILKAIEVHLPPFIITSETINCHHNYVEKEHHYGEDVFVTRKGAVNASEGRLGIIPGSMGTKSYIVEGKGNPESFNSCSHGAGRVMSRSEAKKRFTIQDHIKATQGVECRKDKSVLDETPSAYKDIDKVMEAQKDLVSIKHTLKQVICIKG